MDQLQSEHLRGLYIGAVTLLCRVHALLDRDVRMEFDTDGGAPMERLARDFNAQGFSLKMERAGGGWGLFSDRDG